jgi:hypothetical protein
VQTLKLGGWLDEQIAQRIQSVDDEIRRAILSFTDNSLRSQTVDVDAVLRWATNYQPPDFIQKKAPPPDHVELALD